MGLYPGPFANRPEPERGQVRQGCRIGQGHLHVGNRGDPDLRGVRGRRAGSHEQQAAGAGHRHPPMSLVPSRILETIDRICLLGGAGVTGRARELAMLYQASRRLAGEPLCAAWARRLEAALHPGAAVLLLTGAGAPPSLPWGETDGPLGAAVLARGVVLAFGARPLVVAEARFRGPVVAALDALADGAPDSAWRRAVRYAPFSFL